MSVALDSIYNFLWVNERIGSSGQPTAEQLEAIQAVGYEVVINLLPDTKERLPNEAAHIASLGMEYVSIPVWWDSPELSDLAQFFEAMERHANRRVFVHCAANMRASAFLYLYHLERNLMEEPEAKTLMNRIWEPNPIWRRFIERAKAQISNPDAAGASCAPAE